MSAEMWSELANRLEIRPLLGVKPFRKPSARQLDAYEKATGFKLPKSYRQFVQTFGAGELFGAFFFAAPGVPKDNQRFNLAAADGFYHESQPDLIREYPKQCKDPERALWLHVFGETVRTAFLGWDPHEVTDPDAPEYAVYELDRLDLIRRADDFREFIEEYCLGPGFLVDQDWDEEEDGPRHVYEPAGS